jgi:peptidylprolyl isomerase
VRTHPDVTVTVPIPPRGIRRTRLLAAATLSALVALPALAACSSSTAPDGSKGAPALVQDTAAPGAGSAVAALPAVAHATDLAVKPVPAAGKGTPPTTLLTKDLVVGSGATATTTSTATVQYVGALWNGTQFQATWDKGGAVPFALDSLIPGFTQGVAGMKVGGRRELVIPPALGYSDQAQPGIPANSTLIFVIDLKAVK